MLKHQDILRRMFNFINILNKFILNSNLPSEMSFISINWPLIANGHVQSIPYTASSGGQTLGLNDSGRRLLIIAQIS